MIQIVFLLVISYFALVSSKEKVLLSVLFVLPFHFLLKSFLGKLLGGAEILASWKELVFIILFIRMLADLLHKRIVLNSNYPLILILLYFLFATMLVVVSPNISDALVSYKNLVFPLICFFISIHIDFEKLRQYSFFKWIAISAIVVSAVCYLQNFVFNLQFAMIMNLYEDINANGEIVFTQSASKIMGIDRMYGPFAGPNELGLYMSLIILILTCYMFLGEKIRNKTLIIVSLILSASVLLLTYSRVSWFMFLFSLILYLLLRERRIKLLFISLAIFISLGVIVSIIVPDLGEIFISSITLKEASAQDRTNVFSLGLNKILENPNGYGLGSIQYSSTNPRAWPTEIFWWLVLGEQGIVFGILLILIYIKSSVIGFRNQISSNVFFNTMPIFMIVVILGGFGSVIIFEPIFQVFLWSFIGLGYNKTFEYAR